MGWESGEKMNENILLKNFLFSFFNFHILNKMRASGHNYTGNFSNKLQSRNIDSLIHPLLYLKVLNDLYNGL